MAQAVRLLHPVELVGSTHAERVAVLSEAINKVNPQTDPTKFNALFDAYLINMAYERGDRG